jgi:hypothetical protein
MVFYLIIVIIVIYLGLTLDDFPNIALNTANIIHVPKTIMNVAQPDIIDCLVSNLVIV